MNRFLIKYEKLKQNVFSNYLFYSFLIVLLLTSLFTIPLKAQSKFLSDINFSGDFRLRYENTANLGSGESVLKGRNREVVRLRAGITKDINKMINFGTRITTGSSNDPNTADVTVGNFVNDLEVSLDRLYLAFKSNGFYSTGGKFANPFLRTDLVWDGDVNPQGISAGYTFSGIKKIIPKITGIFYIIDEYSVSSIPDNEMFGGQLEIGIKPSDNSKITLAGAYYNYNVTNLISGTGDAGDFRSNYLIQDTINNTLEYRSDFNLVDIIAIIEFHSLFDNFPLKLVGDYVKNVGSKVDQDQGLMLDLYLGKASNKNDIRFRYGYSFAETDAVLAAFSNDNTTIATNYIQHTFTIDYVVLKNTTLNLTWYLYKFKEIFGSVPNDFISRLRLNAIITF